MKAGIMQPYFFPYLGYFSLIKHVDLFILFDTVQYIRHGWIERNRILKPDAGWQYIQVPIIKPEGRDSLIKDVLIKNEGDWKRKILAQLQHYKKKAPYYKEIVSLINEVFADDYDDIVRLNQKSLSLVCKYLGFEKELPILSTLNLKIEDASLPDEWALNICKALGNVDEYWNPPGGKDFFNPAKYLKAGIGFKFHNVCLKEYRQGRGQFESGLSIIDVLMFNSIEEVNMMLERYELS
jgi:hypothetical protein